MRKKPSSILCNNQSYFTKQQINAAITKFGILKKEVLESHIWCYEIFGQLQKRAEGRFTLKGGACTQLYLPLDTQRCTPDLDCVTELSKKELFNILSTIKNDFNANRLPTTFREYIPKKVRREGRTIPMATFILDLPFIFKTGKRRRLPGLKIDFLFMKTDVLHTTKIDSGEVIGLKLNYSPQCIDLYSMISDKLLTLAASSIGLDINRIEAIYKNIYDLYNLINTYNTMACFKAVAQRLQHSLYLETEMKNAPTVTVEYLLEDIFLTLCQVFQLDLIENYIVPVTLCGYEQEYLQEEMRNELNIDKWSIMSMYLLIWISALKDYIQNKDSSKLNGINLVLDEYEHYLSMERRQKKLYISALKERITSKGLTLNLNPVTTPLRIIYLDYIVSNLPLFDSVPKLNHR